MRGVHVLIAGCGDIGAVLARQLLAMGCRVAGLRRRVEALPRGVEPLQADLAQPDSLRCLQRSFDAVVFLAAPGEYSEHAYRRVYVEGIANLLEALPGEPRLLMASSTSVYHQHDGEWVDEDSPTEPRSFAGRLILQSEASLLRRRPGRASVLRFGGIYGPGRERLLRETVAGIGCPEHPVRFSNRIHRDDCAGVLLFLLQRMVEGSALQSCYLGVDCEPAPEWEVRHWLAARLGVSLDDTRSTGSQRKPGSKRCSNRRLLEAGYRFSYPDYRAGYTALIDRIAQP